MYAPPNQPNPYAPQPYGAPPQQPQYAPQPYGAPPQNPYGVPPQQPQYAPSPYGAHPGIQQPGQAPSLSFDHLDGVDGEGGGGPKLPNGTYWLRICGARQRVSKNPKSQGVTFFILETVVVQSLNPQAPVPPGGTYGHSISQSNGHGMVKCIKAMVGVIVGRSTNDVPGNWVGKLITQPECVMDTVVQFEVSDEVAQGGHQYKRWQPTMLIPDQVVAQYLASVNPVVRQQCFPNGLRSERNAPLPITFFEGGAAPQAPAAGAYPPIQPPQQPVYAPSQQPPQPVQQWQPQPPQTIQPNPQPPYGGPAPMQPPQPMQPGQWPQQQR